MEQLLRRLSPTVPPESVDMLLSLSVCFSIRVCVMCVCCFASLKSLNMQLIDLLSWFTCICGMSVDYIIAY